MLIIKYIVLIMIFISTAKIGIIISKRFQNRVNELKNVKTNLNILSTKIKMTYEPIPQIFKEIGKIGNSNINKVFSNAADKMKNLSAGEAWIMALKEQNTYLKNEDIEVIKNLSNLLGKVDVEGQINEIELVDSFIDTQLKNAEAECRKNTKMYRTLGVIVGLAMVIILI